VERRSQVSVTSSRGRAVTARSTSTPSALWNVVSDVPGVAMWSEEIERSLWTTRASADEVVRGDRFESHVRLGTMAWTSPGTVTGAVPGRSLELTIGDPGNPVAVWSFELRQVGDGVDVTYAVDLGAGDSMLAPMAGGDARVLDDLEQGRLDSLAAGMARTLDRIVQVAEQG